MITVAGVLFSITILVLQLASQQFGPRMLRNFIRDLGTQASLGAFVATFAYSILALASVEGQPARDFVPHLSVTVALALTVVDLGIVIYFIHHVATSIQLTSVVSGIARDFRATLANVQADAVRSRSGSTTGPDPSALGDRVRAVGCSNIRIIEPVMTLDRLIKGATDKIRQAGAGMPAVLIRQLENLRKLMGRVTTPRLRDVVAEHARRIVVTSDETVRDVSDRQDVRAAYDAAVAHRTGPSLALEIAEADMRP